MPTRLCIAAHDFDLNDEERTIPISKGEYVVVFSQATHQNESLYPDGHKFVIDWFTRRNNQGNMAHVPSRNILPFWRRKMFGEFTSL